MICFPCAKINIGLSVLNKRCDGYHNIQSILYPLYNYFDCLEINESSKIEFESFGLEIPGNFKDNLVYRAYLALKADFNLPCISIRLIKRIPMGSGLGGGSSDASATLLLLNDLFSLGLSRNDLMEYAATLGSDCPFFILNQPALATAKGNVIEPVDLSLKGYHITLIHPGYHISTQQAYQNLEIKPKRVKLAAEISLPVEEWKNHIHNDFETYCFAKYPLLASLKQVLYDAGALYVSMTGSGSTLYAISNKNIQFINLHYVFSFWNSKIN